MALTMFTNHDSHEAGGGVVRVREGFDSFPAEIQMEILSPGFKDKENITGSIQSPSTPLEQAIARCVWSRVDPKEDTSWCLVVGHRPRPPRAPARR